MPGQPQDPTLFKLLSHPDRLAVLRRLMAAQSTLSQLGEAMHKSPAHIRHHLKRLEQAGLVEFSEARTVQGGPEKYYRATQKALFIHEAVLPEAPDGKTPITIGSMDPGIHQLAAMLDAQQLPFHLQPLPISSLDGLISLRLGLCQMTTCHLIDPQTEEYNRPIIRRLFPGQAIALTEVYRREEGLMVKPGNPLNIRALEDLCRPDVRFINREPGSGVRQWLDLQLVRASIMPENITGYANIARSHEEVAGAVLQGRADTGIGVAAHARELDLEFIPLFEEPYEIAAPETMIHDDRYAGFFDALTSSNFRAAVRRLDGYLATPTSGNIEIIR